MVVLPQVWPEWDVALVVHVLGKDLLPLLDKIHLLKVRLLLTVLVRLLVECPLSGMALEKQ